MKRLTLTYRGESVLSSPFNLGAYRRIHDRLKDKAISAELLDAAAIDAVIFMFDGTAIREDVLLQDRGIDSAELLFCCEQVLAWYGAVQIRPDQTKYVGKLPDDPILNIYHHMLMRRGILPDELDRQDPQLLFDVMAQGDGDAVSEEQIPGAYRAFYGL